VTPREATKARWASGLTLWLLISLPCIPPAHSVAWPQETGATALPGIFGISGTPPARRLAQASNPIRNIRANSRAAAPPVAPVYLPGQVIVKFKSSLTECAHCLLAKHQAFATALSDGSGSLDELNRRHRVSGGRSVFVDRENSTTPAAQAEQSRLRQGVERRFSKRSARVLANSIVPDLTNVYVLDLPRDADVAAISREYAADPHVDYAHPNYLIKTASTPNDPYFSSANSWGQGYDDLWGVKKIMAPEAWGATQGQGITVAVVDTGVDYTHPDIAGNIVPGWNYLSGTNDPMDDNGHGTHVAGTIAAVGNNGLGIIGVAPQAKIMPVKALDHTGSGSSDTLAVALLFSAQHGADVINNSWGCPRGCVSVPVLEDAVRSAYSLGAVVVFAAGNEGSNVLDYSPQNMLDAKPIVAAATTAGDTDTFFSNRGILIDIAAPGSDILSLRSTVCESSVCDPARLVGDRYLRLDGTSMAAPHVSGAAALVLSHAPGLTNEEVRQVLRVSADALGTGGFDRRFGEGRINVSRALGTDSVLQATITNPSPLSIYDPIGIGSPWLEIRGSAAGAAFRTYQLFYAFPSQPETWIPVSSPVGAPVHEGTLGTLRIREFATGLYVLKLVCTSAAEGRFEAFSQFAIESGLTRISTPLDFDEYPSVSGHRVVWTRTDDFQGGWVSISGDIHVYDLTTREETVIPGTSKAAFPKISGDRVVWVDYRNGFLDAGEIYMYDLKTNTERPIAVGPGVRSDPAISGDRIVWLQKDDPAGDAPYSIRLYDLSDGTARQITGDTARPIVSESSAALYDNVAISGNWIVWTDTRNGGLADVFVYDLATGAERQLTEGATSLYPPASISGDRVVWEQAAQGPNGDWYWNLFVHDLTTGARRSIRTGPGLPYWPRISGDRVVWKEYRTDNWDIYSYDLRTNSERQITSQFLAQRYEDISGDTVVWMDDRDGSHIFMYELPSGEGQRRPRTITVPRR
jgi:beta propeller repeat protein